MSAGVSIRPKPKYKIKYNYSEDRHTVTLRAQGVYTLTEQFPCCVPSHNQLFSMQSILRLHEKIRNSVHKYMHVTH